jgi:hypothetical protein
MLQGSSTLHRLIALAKRKAASARFRTRVAFGHGALPNALILGAAKAGTTSLFEWLSQHPEVAPSRIKEVRFFDLNFERGRGWYAAQFSPGPRHRIVLEASPGYLWNQSAPGRVRALLGSPRLIVLLREPVDRAYSHHAMKVREGWETLSFPAAIEAEPGRLDALAARAAAGGLAALEPHERFAYASESLYAEQIERWLAAFPRRNFLFVRAEDLFRDPKGELARILGFLELSPFDFPDLDARNVGAYSPIDPHLREALERSFAASNRRLSELTGIEWPRARASRLPSSLSAHCGPVRAEPLRPEGTGR